MEKRRIVFGDYNTAHHGWTLAAWVLSAPEQKTLYIDKPNGDGAWDLSTAQTDGVMRYKNRSLTATLECSEGTRKERETIIRQMINQLDGAVVEIKLPDDDHHHLVGRLHVVREYNDLAHAAVSVAAVCEPWKYADAETIVTVAATSTKQRITLYNGGRRVVVPTISTAEGSVLLECGDASLAVSSGAYQWPSLVLTPGATALTVSGSGVVAFKYREAVLE